MRKPASQVDLSRTQLTHNVTRLTLHGASQLMHAMSVWSAKARRAPSRHSRGVMVNDLKATTMHEMSTPPPPGYLWHRFLGHNQAVADDLIVLLLRYLFSFFVVSIKGYFIQPLVTTALYPHFSRENCLELQGDIFLQWYKQGFRTISNNSRTPVSMARQVHMRKKRSCSRRKLPPPVPLTSCIGMD